MARAEVEAPGVAEGHPALRVLSGLPTAQAAKGERRGV